MAAVPRRSLPFPLPHPKKITQTPLRGSGSLWAATVVLAVLLLAGVIDAFRPLSSFAPQQQRHATGKTKLHAATRARSRTDYYEILGLAPGATPEEVKMAFRERAKSTHPDASRTTDTTAEFLVIKEAYEILYDAQRRSEFDRRRQMAEAADLAVSVGQILTMDIAVPLARDVAIPLIKATFKGLDQTFIKKIAEPLLRQTIEQSSAAIENVRKAAQDQSDYFLQMQANWRAEEIRGLSNQLEELAARAQRTQEQAKAAASALSASVAMETMARTKLESQTKIGQDLSARSQALQEESTAVLAAFKARVAEEELYKHTAKKIKTEQTRVAISAKRLETFVFSADAEVAEAEELLRRAQMRADKAREARVKAVEQLEASLLEARILEEDFTQTTAALAAASEAVAPQRQAWEAVQEQEKQLVLQFAKHAKQDQVLKAELTAAARKREASQREFDSAQKSTAIIQRQVVDVAGQIDKKYNEVSGSGITSASSAVKMSLSPEELKKQQKEVFETVFGSNGQGKVSPPVAAAAPAKTTVQEDKASLAAAAASFAAVAKAETEMKRQEARLEKEILEKEDSLNKMKQSVAA